MKYSGCDDQYNSFCRGELSDPYPFFAEMRREDPVHWSEQMNSWVLFQYRDVAEGLKDYDNLSSDRSGIFMQCLSSPDRSKYGLLGEHFSKWLAMTDRPRHTYLRRLMNKAFTPRQINSYEPLILNLVDQLIEKCLKSGESDFIRDIAYPLPALVIAKMLGVPDRDIDKFKIWSDRVSDFLGGSRLTFCSYAPKAHESLVALIAYIDDLIVEFRKYPDENMISMLLAVEEESEGLSHEDVVAMSTLMLIAGHETTRGLLGNGLMLLLRHPEQLSRLFADPTLIEFAVEEMLRYESPLQRQTRLVLKDFEVQGKKISQGQSLMLLQGSANHDPECVPDPECFDIGRQVNNHVTFGRGIHFCLGAPLARLEARITLPRVLERMPELRLATEELQWRANMNFRSLTKLPVTFKASTMLSNAKLGDPDDSLTCDIL